MVNQTYLQLFFRIYLILEYFLLKFIYLKYSNIFYILKLLKIISLKI